jgi:hypothetical protein
MLAQGAWTRATFGSMSESRSLLRQIIPYVTVLIVVAVCYDGWIFYSRWSSARAVEQERTRAEADRDRKTVEMLGGDQLKILAFYASPPTIRAGGQSLICFGVNSAKNVRIDPPVQELHPALSRCFPVTPAHDTEYTLTADDGAGHSAKQTLTLRVIR